tara:strand:+ start:1487 stop:2059 length:573 start_codon:yes stop_codon:yes gene_type:complete
MKGKLIVISAPSGAGKTTIARKLQKININWGFSVSCTTRPKRKDEINFKDYEFISENKFKERIINNELLEYENIHGYLYGTPINSIKKSLNENKTIIVEVDVNGGLAIKLNYPKNAISIFIHPPNLNVLKERLIKRGSDSLNNINKRLKRANMEIKKSNEFDIQVINIDIDNAVDEINKKLSKIIKQGEK